MLIKNVLTAVGFDGAPGDIGAQQGEAAVAGQGRVVQSGEDGAVAKAWPRRSDVFGGYWQGYAQQSDADEKRTDEQHRLVREF